VGAGNARGARPRRIAGDAELQVLNYSKASMHFPSDWTYRAGTWRSPNSGQIRPDRSLLHDGSYLRINDAVALALAHKLDMPSRVQLNIAIRTCCEPRWRDNLGVKLGRVTTLVGRRRYWRKTSGASTGGTSIGAVASEVVPNGLVSSTWDTGSPSRVCPILTGILQRARSHTLPAAL